MRFTMLLPRRRRVLSLAVVASGFLAGCTHPVNDPTAYDDQTRANFVAGCTGNFTGSGTTLAAQSTCECAYNWFVDNVSISDFNAVSNGLRSGPDNVPDAQKAVWERAQRELPAICTGWVGGAASAEEVPTGPMVTVPGTRSTGSPSGPTSDESQLPGSASTSSSLG
ncbi:MAG: hypothetical protein N2037_06375 [Acidimicrobiales bacterium]|nr:hypothetical protein [Acidimicrobiales bacterium]